MNQALLFLLDISDADQGAFTSLIRSFFAGIIRFLYDWIGKLVDVMYDLASKDLGMGNLLTLIADKIFIVLIIFMIFKLTISVMTYLVEPDSFNDNSKGIQGIIKRVIISIVLLISINPIFALLHDLQDIIIDDDIITNLIMGTSNDSIFVTDEGDRAYLTQISPFCNDIDPDAKVVTFSQGDHLALLTLRPFIQPVNDTGDYTERVELLTDNKYCGLNISDDEEIAYVDTSSSALASSFAGPHSASDYMQYKFYNGYTGKWSTENNVYLLDFNYFFALIVGIVVFLILISFCFDVVIRSFSLLLLQVMAPIPIISYISPKGKMSEMLGTWFKKVISTWLSLFIKMLALTLALVVLGEACEALQNDNSGFLMQIVIIIGALMFAKKLPQLLEELIPGLKLGGMELNPFKRISKDALGGNMLLGAGAGLAAAGMSGLTNGIQRAGQTVGNVRNAKGIRAKLGAAGSGLGRTLGSTVAGATRGGINAFGRTSKDGRIFSGAWNGYQTSMFSKLQREDNLRKAGLEDAGLSDRARFAIGGVLSDAQRFTGTLNSGQREYLNAARQDEIIKSMEKDLANEKREKLEPLQTYSKYASRIKERIDNSKEVKDAKEDYDIAVASGNIDRIKDAKKFLDEKKASIADKLFRDDNEIKDLTSRMEKLRKENTILQAEQYDFMKKDKNGYNTFASGSIYNTQNVSNVIERNIESKDIYDVEGYKRGDSKVVSAVNDQYNNGIDLGSYKDNHNENSQAKLQNASRMNKDVQQPGFKPSSGPVQETAFDRYVGGHPGGHPSGHGGGPVPPPPPGGHNP